MPANPPSSTPPRRGSRSAPRPGSADRRAPASELPKPLRWVKELFSSKLRVERRGAQIHVLLDPPPPAPPPPAGPTQRRSETLRKSQAELRALLDRHADTRHVVPHLSYVEQLLETGGMRALGRLPLPVLHKSLTQLEALMHDEPGAGLAELRRRLAAVIALRLGGTPGQPAVPIDRQEDMHLEVSEASHSQFDALERSWTGTMPGELGALVAATRATS